MPTSARREISAIEMSASGSANAARAAVMIFCRLRLRLQSASACLAGVGLRSGRQVVRRAGRRRSEGVRTPRLGAA
jgi:hypothetical protein